MGLNEAGYYMEKSSPTQIPGTTWDAIDMGAGGTSNSIFCRKTDGTLWSWGYGGNGKLGHNNTTRKSSPTQIPGDWSGSEIMGGSAGAYAIKSDGTLWWIGGYGLLGTGGQNNGISRSSPTQIPGTNWRSVGESSFAVHATKTDGTLWAWGRNNYGQLGLNQASPTKLSSPTQIPGIDWGHVSKIGGGAAGGGTGYIFCTKANGTLWGWGGNVYGQLGVGDKVQRSSPTQVTGTYGWVNITTCNNPADCSFGFKQPY